MGEKEKKSDINNHVKNILKKYIEKKPNDPKKTLPKGLSAPLLLTCSDPPKWFTETYESYFLKRTRKIHIIDK